MATEQHAGDQPDDTGRRRFAPRTGAEQPWDPEDLARAAGQDPTPENVERWRRKLEAEGASAVEKLVP